MGYRVYSVGSCQSSPSQLDTRNTSGNSLLLISSQYMSTITIMISVKFMTN